MFDLKPLFIFPAGVIILAAGCASTVQDVQKPVPAWLQKSIVSRGDYIYSVGHSSPKKTAKEARDEAIASATTEFVRYCRVDVQSFDRSIEIYSKQKGKEFYSQDIEAQSIIRARAFVSKAIPEDWHIRREGRKYVASVLLQIPKEEFDRIIRGKDIKLSLDVFFYYEDEQGKVRVLSEGSVLKSGDSYALYVRPSDSSYLYVYQVDAMGKTYRLFPNPEFKTATNPVSPAGDIWIPNESDLFFLDDTTGKERIFIFASSERVAEFEGRDAINLKKVDLDRVIKIKKMGVAGIKKKRDSEKVNPPQHARQVAEVKRKLQAKGTFVYETWFWHK